MKDWERQLRLVRARRVAETRRSEVEPYMRGPRSKLDSSQTYMRDERLFMRLLRKFVPKKQHYNLPSSPGLLMRTDQGIRPFKSLMADDRIWSASPEAKRAKAVIMQIYRKWHHKNMWDYD